MDELPLKKKAKVVIADDSTIEHITSNMAAVALAGVIHELQIPEMVVQKEGQSRNIDIYYSDSTEKILVEKKEEVRAALAKRLDAVIARRLMVTLYGYETY